MDSTWNPSGVQMELIHTSALYKLWKIPTLANLSQTLLVQIT